MHFNHKCILSSFISFWCLLAFSLNHWNMLIIVLLMSVSSISSKLFLLGTITMDLTILAGVNIVYFLHYFCFCKRIWASGNRLLIIYFRISFSPPSRVLILGNRCFGVVLRVSVFNTDHMKSSVDNKGAQDTPTHIHTQCGNWTTFGKVAKRG